MNIKKTIKDQAERTSIASPSSIRVTIEDFLPASLLSGLRFQISSFKLLPSSFSSSTRAQQLLAVLQ